MTELQQHLERFLENTESVNMAMQLIAFSPVSKDDGYEYLQEEQTVVRRWGPPGAFTSFSALDGDLIGDCACRHGVADDNGRCIHLVAVAYELSQAANDEGEEHESYANQLERDLATSENGGVLEWLDELTAPLRDETTTLSWSVDHVDDARPVVQLHQVELLEGGRTSAPVQVTGDDIPRLLRASPRAEDRRALKLIETCRSHGSPMDWDAALPAALSALVGHPRVHLHGWPEPVDVVGPRPTIHVIDDGDHYAVLVTVGDSPMPEHGGSHVYEASSRRLHVGPVSSQLRALARQCEDDSTGGVAVEKNLGRDLLEKLWAFADEADFLFDPSLEPRERECDGRLRVALERSESGWSVRVVVRPLGAEGPASPPGEGPTVALSSIDGEPVMTLRRRDTERRAAEDLAPDVGLHFTSPQWAMDITLDQTLALAKRLAGRRDVVVEWPARAPRILSGPAKLDIAVGGGTDWFGVSGTVEVDGSKVKLADILRARRESRRFLEVAPDKFVDLAEVFDRRLKRLDAALRDEQGRLVMGRRAVVDDPRLLDGVDSVHASPEWARLAAQALELQSTCFPLPEAFRGTLRDYQRDGFDWLMQRAARGSGAILADDMGLGKTAQTIAALLARASGGAARIIVPTSAVGNWQRELAKFAPSLRVRVLGRDDRGPTIESAAEGDVLIVTWAELRSECGALAARWWHTVVCDEARFAKNGDTATASAARDLVADWRLLLSGTLVENRLLDLHSLIEIAEPGALGSREEFRRRFADPIEHGSPADAKRARAELVKPFVLRRRKADVLTDLPPRHDVRVDVELTPEERAIYEAERQHALANLDRVDTGNAQQLQFHALAALLRLRLAACCALLVSEVAPMISAKTRVPLKLLADFAIEDRSTLVFSAFTRHLDRIAAALKANGIAYRMLTGAHSQAERRDCIDAFQSGQVKVLLISLKAGGTALNLTKASVVVHMDPWWNPAAEDQASDRAHRLGQTRPVDVIRLVAKGTIEEQVLDLHARKRGLLDGVLDDGEVAARLTGKELLALVRSGG